VVICLERGADLHIAQLMPLPLTVSCFSKMQIGFTFLVSAHPGSPGQRAVKRVCACVCVCVGVQSAAVVVAVVITVMTVIVVIVAWYPHSHADAYLTDLVYRTCIIKRVAIVELSDYARA